MCTVGSFHKKPGYINSGQYFNKKDTIMKDLLTDSNYEIALSVIIVFAAISICFAIVFTAISVCFAVGMFIL